MSACESYAIPEVAILFTRLDIVTKEMFPIITAME